MPELQDPKNAPHLRHAEELVKLDAHIVHFRSVGDENEAQAYEARRKHTADRLEFAKAAVLLVDQLGLTHEVTAKTVTYNDGVNFVARVLHEMHHGVKSSIYARSHKGVRGMTSQWEGQDGKKIDVVHCDEAKFTAPRDPAAEVCEHLGLQDPEKAALVQKFFASVVKA